MALRPGKGGALTAVLVTGASGFIGQALCGALEAQGHQVRRATRKSLDRVRSPASAIGNIGPDTDWQAAVTGCDAVVHLAAHVHVMGRQKGDPASDHHRVNVEGSENLARQAAQAGVRSFVFLSSVKVNGECSVRQAFTEQSPMAPVDAYGSSKAEAEERLRAIAAESGMEVVILRPPLVYGPGVKANFLNLLRAVDTGLPLPFASLNNRRSLIYVGNLVSAVETCISHAAAGNQTYMVSDGSDVSTAQLVVQIAAALKRTARLLPCPAAWLKFAGRLTGREEQIARLTQSLQVDISKIRGELGWQPPFTLQQGLAETADWYRSTRRETAPPFSGPHGAQS